MNRRWTEGGNGKTGGGNKGKQVSDLKEEKERRRREGGRMSDAGRMTAAQHPPPLHCSSPGLTSDLQTLPGCVRIITLTFIYL